eukprot:gene33075-42279_t
MIKSMRKCDDQAMIVKVANEDCYNINQYELNTKDFVRLMNKRWIDDTLINAYMSLLRMKCSRLRLDSICLANTYVWTMMKQLCNINDVSKKMTFDRLIKQNADIYIFPVLIRGNHWIAITFNIKEDCIFVYDSLKSTKMYNETEFKKVYKTFINLRHQCSVDRPEKNIKIQYVNMGPRQSNTYDCGIYVLSFAEMMCSNAPVTHNFGKELEKYARCRFAVRLRNCRID